MPLKISAKEDKAYNDTECDYAPYTVYVDDHRILTIFSRCYQTTTKWIKGIQKSPPNNYKHGCILVGICADHNSDLIHYDSRIHNYPDPEVVPYHLLQICVGSHCFLYRLPDDAQTPKALQAFFADPRVIAVGMKMKSLSKKLETEHGIKFANPVDLNDLAEKGMKRHDLDLGRYDLDRLAKAVLGKHWDVVRREGYVPWFYSMWWRDDLTVEKAEMATVDPFLCFMIGNELLEMMDDSWYPREFKKFLIKMNKGYKKNKGKEKKKFR